MHKLILFMLILMLTGTASSFEEKLVLDGELLCAKFNAAENVDYVSDEEESNDDSERESNFCPQGSKECLAEVLSKPCLYR